VGVPDFLAAFVDGQFFVQAGDHFSDAGLGEALGAGGVGLLQLFQAAGQEAEFFRGFFGVGGALSAAR
jgi:hypothetical protein